MPSSKKVQASQKRFIEKYGGLCFFLIPQKYPMEPAMCPSYKKSPDCWYNEKRGLDQWLSGPTK